MSRSPETKVTHGYADLEGIAPAGVPRGDEITAPGQRQFKAVILIGHAQESTDYALTFGSQGIAEMHLEVEVRTHSADGRSGEEALDDLFAAGSGASSSVYDALLSSDTLGGTISRLRVVNVRPPRPLGNGVWSAAYIVAIYQARS